MIYKDLKEDCEECPIYKEMICPGGWKAGYGGVPIEPPCCSFEEDTDLDEWVNSYYSQMRLEEEERDALLAKRKEKERRNKIKNDKRNYLKSHCYVEYFEVKRLKKAIKSLEKAIDFASSFVSAFNTTNEMFRYNERKSVNPALNEKLETLKNELKIAENKLREKQKECRKTEEYKNIGEKYEK